MERDALMIIYREFGVNLSPVGNKLRGFCPFHVEKKPSFVVFPDNGSYRCFGCGEYGSFDKIQKLLGDETNLYPLFKIDVNNIRDKSSYLIYKLLQKMENDLSGKLKDKRFETRAEAYDKFDRMKIGVRFMDDENTLNLVLELKKRFAEIIENI